MALIRHCIYVDKYRQRCAMKCRCILEFYPMNIPLLYRQSKVIDVLLIAPGVAVSGAQDQKRLIDLHVNEGRDLATRQI